MILAVVRYRTPMHVRRMAGWALKEFATLLLPYSEADLEVAVENCLAKGWLRVLSEKDVGRQPPSYSTFASYNRGSPGVLDFTAEGNALAVRLWGVGRVGGARPDDAAAPNRRRSASGEP